MDCVYICRSGENEELRYSLRSIEKNLEYENLWIVGDAPDWYYGNLKTTIKNAGKYTIARTNLYKIAESDDIAEEFILMNDDFFVMQHFSTPPTWHNGLLEDSIKERARKAPGSYTEMLRETYSKLRRMSIETILDYELHVPMKMTKTGLRQALMLGGLWRSMYGNMNNVGGEEHKDVKLYKRESSLRNHDLDIYTSPFLSTTDEAFPDLLDQRLRDAFPDPSQYELI